MESEQDEKYSHLGQPEVIKTKNGIFWYDGESNAYKPVKEPSPINTLGDKQAPDNYQQDVIGRISFVKIIKVTNWLLLDLQ